MDIFIETAETLGLPYEIVPVSTKAEYEDVVLSGDIGVWMDADSRKNTHVGTAYKITTPYLTTTMSALRLRGAEADPGRCAEPPALDIVPGATLDLMMGVNAQDSVLFLGLWEKTLTRVSNNIGAEIAMELLQIIGL